MTAAASSHDIADPDGAEALIELAAERFGRSTSSSTTQGSSAGPFAPGSTPTTRAASCGPHARFVPHHPAAWPLMVEQGYGRIVNTASAGVFGLPANVGYATAKGGVIGLTRSLATAAARHGIRVNVIAPAAVTRVAGDPGDTDPTAMDPDLVAPMAAYLAHEDCPVNGEMYAAGAGRFARIFLATTEGWVDPSGSPTVEDVAAHWAEVNAETGYSVPADLMAWSAGFLAHLPATDDPRSR
ncbi:MAG: SDR family NAD(P)-dependent oxidoreductase [Acidimicrobiales bacterium]